MQRNISFQQFNIKQPFEGFFNIESLKTAHAKQTKYSQLLV